MSARADRATIEFAVDRMRAARHAHAGTVPRGWLNEIGAALGVPRSTLQRYVAQGVPAAADRSRWRWEGTARAAYYRAAGDVTYARELLSTEHPDEVLPSVRTMQRTRDLDFTADERALAEKGHAAARGKRLVVAVEDADRNEVWLADHKQLDVDVLPPRGTIPVKPWMTVIIDGYSRRAVGVSISLRPNQGHVLAALGMAIRRCGTPRALIFDQGREFLARSVTEHAAELGYVAMATLAYHPHHKGKVERFHQTLNRMLTHACGTTPTPAVNIRGKPLLGAPPVIPLPRFEELFFQTHEQYENRGHRSLQGSTPNEVYAEDATPERRVPDAVLRRYLLSKVRRTIVEYGVRFAGRHYYAPEFEGNLGTKIEVRYAQDDQRQLEIYRGDRHWCTARLSDPASPEQVEEVLRVRREHLKRQRKDLAAARRLARAQTRASTDRQRAENSTVITGAEAARETSGVPQNVMDLLNHLQLRTDLDDPDTEPPTTDERDAA
ncbi:DDE-type integrase/transposase/recombinase [Patulibacter minatonensis]|uniref:DDE-type integrase/transposase/recombinase n=1 Tax=Patulibacter minatonensis TaxID=298163 RepID=UPI0004795860|nr:DDE-type integrase/transposase/recombinase [Patulibacter minatonensis]